MGSNILSSIATEYCNHFYPYFLRQWKFTFHGVASFRKIVFCYNLNHNIRQQHRFFNFIVIILTSREMFIHPNSYMSNSLKLFKNCITYITINVTIADKHNLFLIKWHIIMM